MEEAEALKAKAREAQERVLSDMQAEFETPTPPSDRDWQELEKICKAGAMNGVPAKLVVVLSLEVLRNLDFVSVGREGLVRATQSGKDAIVKARNIYKRHV